MFSAYAWRGLKWVGRVLGMRCLGCCEQGTWYVLGMAWAEHVVDIGWTVHVLVLGLAWARLLMLVSP
jgi:hypothetical protein